MSFFLGWHLLDIFFLLLGCYFVIKGAFRGFVKEALSFGALIVTVWVGFRHSDTIGVLLGRTTGLNKEVAQVLAVVLVWLVISIIFSIIQRIMERVIEFTSLGSINRILGILTGLLKTTIVIYIVLVGGLLLAPIVEPTWMAQSDILVYSGRKWPEVRRMMIDIGALPKSTELPDGTLERILRPYRRGDGALPGSLEALGEPPGNRIANNGREKRVV